VVNSLPDYMRRPTLESSAERRIRRLKRRLVLELFLQRARFWDAVWDVRTEWNVTARRMLPSDGDLETYAPVDQAPEKPAPYKFTKSIGLFFDRWHDALRPSLRDGFVPDELKRWLSWDDFFGACVMCDPPDDRLLEFAEFGRLYPIVFWPVVDREPTEIDASKIHSMVAPPVERVFKESYEEGEPSFEYRIVVDGETREQDVINACRAIKAAYGQSLRFLRSMPIHRRDRGRTARFRATVGRTRRCSHA
jgi:hypothetical protein